MISSLNISDFELEKVDVVTNTKYRFAFLLNFKLGRYFYFRHITYRLNKAQELIDGFLADVSAEEGFVDAKTYDHVVELLDAIIEQNYKSKSKFADIPIFSDTQRKELSSFFTTLSKRTVKVKAVLSKKYHSGKPRVDDSHLVSLVVNNNTIELKKALTK